LCCIDTTFYKKINIDIKGIYSNNVRQSTDLIVLNKRYKNINLSHCTLNLPDDQIPERAFLKLN